MVEEDSLVVELVAVVVVAGKAAKTCTLKTFSKIAREFCGLFLIFKA